MVTHLDVRMVLLFRFFLAVHRQEGNFLVCGIFFLRKGNGGGMSVWSMVSLVFASPWQDWRSGWVEGTSGSSPSKSNSSVWSILDPTCESFLPAVVVCTSRFVGESELLSAAQFRFPLSAGRCFDKGKGCCFSCFVDKLDQCYFP